MSTNGFEELFLLGNGWRVTNLSELVTGWQAIATDDIHVVIATGGSIGEAIANATLKSETGPFDKVLVGVPYDQPKRSLASIIQVPEPPRINRRI
jgi:hypothetical protein